MQFLVSPALGIKPAEPAPAVFGYSVVAAG